MNLNEIRSLLKNHGFIPKRLDESDIKAAENKIGDGYKIPELLLEFLNITNGCNFGILSNKIITCKVIKSGTYEPFNHPIDRFDLLKVFNYKSSDKSSGGFLYEYDRLDTLSKERMSLSLDRYIPILSGFEETTLFIDKVTNELVSFVNDGEDPSDDERTLVANSIEDFIKRCIVEILW